MSIVGRLFGIESAAQRLSRSVSSRMERLYWKVDRLSGVFNHVSGQSLENGIRSDIKEHKGLKTLQMRVQINSGYSSDPPDRKGIAHFLEHMAFVRSTELIRLLAELERRGGEFGALTYPNVTVYDLKIPYSRRNSRFLMEMAAKLVFGTDFDPDQMKEEQIVIDNEVGFSKDRRERNISQTVQTTSMFFAHGSDDLSYNEHSLGGERHRDALTVDDLQHFHRDHYVGTNTAIYIAAPKASRARIFSLLKRNFSFVPPYPLREQLQIENSVYKGGHKHLKQYEADQTHYAVSFFMPASGDKKQQMAQTVLRRYVEFRLKDKLRGETNRRVYAVNANILSHYGQNILTIQGDIRPQDGDKILPVVSEVMAEIASGNIKKDRFKAIKAQMKREANEQEFFRKTNLHDFDRPLSHTVERFRSAKYLWKVGPNDLTNIVNETLLSRQPTLVTAGDISKMQDFEAFKNMLPGQPPLELSSKHRVKDERTKPALS